jgi:hypothetical protein
MTPKEPGIINNIMLMSRRPSLPNPEHSLMYYFNSRPRKFEMYEPER